MGLPEAPPVAIGLIAKLPPDDQLRVGVADVGLIPAIEYQRIPGLSIVGDCAIATKGAVRSILLLTRKPLAEIRTLRNRIAHHEPIVMWDLSRRYGKIMELTGWLSPATAEWCAAHNQFSQVYPSEPIILHRGCDAER